MKKLVKLNNKEFQVELMGSVGSEGWMNSFKITNSKGKRAELHIAKEERFFEWNTWDDAFFTKEELDGCNHKGQFLTEVFGEDLMECLAS